MSEQSISRSVFNNLLTGNIRKVGEDGYAITPKGEQEAEDLLKTAGGLRAWWQLVAGNASLEDEQFTELDGAVERILGELQHMQQWMGAIVGYAQHMATVDKANAAVWTKVAEMATNDPRKSL